MDTEMVEETTDRVKLIENNSTWADGVKWAEIEVQTGSRRNVLSMIRSNSQNQAFTRGAQDYLKFHKENPTAKIHTDTNGREV